MTQTMKPPAKPKIRQTKLLINNEWVDPVDGGSFDTVNPATGEVIAKVAAAGTKDVDLAVKCARKALENSVWSRMDAADRGRLMYKLAERIEHIPVEFRGLIQEQAPVMRQRGCTRFDHAAAAAYDRRLGRSMVRRAEGRLGHQRPFRP